MARQELIGFDRDIRPAFEIKYSQFFRRDLGRNIPLSEVEDQQGVERAIESALSLQRTGAFHGERIGVIDPNLSTDLFLGDLLPGLVVLFKDNKDGTATILFPWTKAAMKEQIRLGSITDSGITTSVRVGFIRPIGPRQIA